MEASLYIHVPFCAGACDYCDFYSVPVQRTSPLPEDSRLDLFVDTLLSQGQQLFETYKLNGVEQPSRLPTLYIGGGTPSILGAAGTRKLLRGFSRLIDQHCPDNRQGPPMEITVEANPESADEAFLEAAREGGATRLSLGIQSFHGPSRRAVHRVGSGRRGDETLLRQRLTLAAGYFPAAFSGDIISGLPLQDESILLNDIACLLSYKPAHVSLYSLTVEPGTALAKSGAAQATLPTPDEAARLWLTGRDALQSRGYNQYEVSNFCLAGRESQHNIRYWRMQNWLALGPSASATIINDETGTGFRYTVPSDVDAWLSSRKGAKAHRTFGSRTQREWGRVMGNFEELDALTLIKETLLMGFRYTEGPDEALFRRRFRRGIGEFLPKTLSAWQARGLLRKDKPALTTEGLLFLDPFLIHAFQELDTLGL